MVTPVNPVAEKQTIKPPVREATRRTKCPQEKLVKGTAVTNATMRLSSLKLAEERSPVAVRKWKK